MKISAKGRYALLAVMELAAERRRGGRAMRIQQIASRRQVPPRYLVQILLQLNKAGIVGSVRGARGGYTLTRHPSDISVGQVLTAIEGPLWTSQCLEGEIPPECRGFTVCPFKDVWLRISSAVSRIVDAVSFADVTALVQDEPVMYHI